MRGRVTVANMIAMRDSSRGPRAELSRITRIVASSGASRKEISKEIYLGQISFRQWNNNGASTNERLSLRRASISAGYKLDGPGTPGLSSARNQEQDPRANRGEIV